MLRIRLQPGGQSGEKLAEFDAIIVSLRLKGHFLREQLTIFVIESRVLAMKKEVMYMPKITMPRWMRRASEGRE